MKRIFLIFSALCLTHIMYCQTDPVDDLFDKYSEREGFTVVSISGRMFSMFATQDEKDTDADNVISHLKSIRILSVEDSILNLSINFYSEFGKKLDMSVYEELMLVKEGQNITKFLIRQKGDIISELLVISGGPAGNSLISIRGDLNLKRIADLSKDVGIQELESLDKIESKSGKQNKKE